jgi:hypothetical protein
MEFDGRNISYWPAPLRRSVDSIAVLLMQVYMLARGRAAASTSPVVRTLAGRDEEAWKLDWIQRRLDGFRDWYNGQRAMWIHVGRTPDEVYRSTSRPESLPARRCDPQIAFCCVRRIHAGGDHHLPRLDIWYVRRIKTTV